MTAVSYDGVAAVTVDEVADALLEFALVVARYNSYETVTIPVAVQGHVEQLTLMRGPTIHLSALTVSAERESTVEGASEAAAHLRQRARSFTDPLHDLAARVDSAMGH